MFYGINNDVLHSACRLEVVFKDDLGKELKGSGTAFFVNLNNGDICLITNRHVVDKNYNQSTSKYKDFKLSRLIIKKKNKDPITGLPTIDIKLRVLDIEGFIFPSNEENDIVCLKNFHVIHTVSSTVPRIDYAVPVDLIASKEKLTETLTISDFVVFPGFPEWFDKRNDLPVMRVGTVASDPRFDYSYSGSNEGDRLAYEAFSFDGSSGSPVFAVPKGIRTGRGIDGGGFRDGMLIGINAGHLQVSGSQSHSGISYLIKSNVILELLDTPPTKTKAVIIP
jgi:hypothetical protein